MRLTPFVIFISAILSLYTLVNYYIYIRLPEAIPQEGNYHTLYLIIFLFLSLSYLCGRLLERVKICRISTLIIWTGSFWLGAMLYLFPGFLLVDIIVAFLSFFEIVTEPFLSRFFYQGVLMGVVILLGVGFLRARQFAVTRITVTVDSFGKSREDLTLVFISDIHLGTIVNNSRLKRMVDAANSLEPDLVLLGGDILDEDLAPVLARDLGDILRSIRSRFGVYGVTGNHEYFGGVERACKYLSGHGITMLRDEACTVAGIVLAGREDRSIFETTGVRRKSLNDLLAGVDKDLPVLVLDHRPFRHISPSLEAVDLYLAGHTHHGQLWPIQGITNALYALSYGLKKISGTTLYVSSGYGTWGPPVRIGSRPEIVAITMRFGAGE